MIDTGDIDVFLGLDVGKGEHHATAVTPAGKKAFDKRLPNTEPKFRTGSQWVHLPERYGNWRGVYNRLRMWALDGTWERVFTALMAQADTDENLDWAVSVDSTIVRAHQHAAGARKKGPRPASPPTTPSDAPAAG